LLRWGGVALIVAGDCWTGRAAPTET